MAPPVPVVVTGMGVCSAAGCDLRTFWDRLVSGVSCVGPIRRFDAAAYPSRIAAEMDAEVFRASADLSVRWATRGRIGQYAAAAAGAALRDSGFVASPEAARRAGVSLAAG